MVRPDLFPDEEAWEMWRLSKQSVPRLMPLARVQLQRYRDRYHKENFKFTMELIKRQGRLARRFIQGGAAIAVSGIALETLSYDPVESSNPITIAVGGASIFAGYIMKRSIAFNGTVPASPQIQAIDGYLAELNNRFNLNKEHQA